MKYLGSKTATGIHQAIINIMPPHDLYIEPFMGTGYILKQKAPAARSVGIDKNKECIDDFKIKKGYGGEVKIIKGDAFKYLAHLEVQLKTTLKDQRVLVYCDPPYPWATRGKDRYKYDLKNADHEKLLKLLKKLVCPVMISTYKNPIYDKALASWHVIEMQTMTRGGIRTEQVFYNYFLEDVHYHTYAGQNFTDRQRIKRKAERWANNFSTLEPGERQAVLAAILQRSTRKTGDRKKLIKQNAGGSKKLSS